MRSLTAGRVVLGGLFIVALVAAAGVVAELRSWRAAEQIEQTVADSSGTHIARVISVREPGANGKHYLVVRVSRRAANGHVEADSGVLWLENARRVTVRWPAARRLVVEYPAGASVDGWASRVYGIRVSAIPVDSLR